jgi:hypothetical protein
MALNLMFCSILLLTSLLNVQFCDTRMYKICSFVIKPVVLRNLLKNIELLFLRSSIYFTECNLSKTEEFSHQSAAPI